MVSQQTILVVSHRLAPGGPSAAGRGWRCWRHRGDLQEGAAFRPQSIKKKEFPGRGGSDAFQEPPGSGTGAPSGWQRRSRGLPGSGLAIALGDPVGFRGGHGLPRALQLPQPFRCRNLQFLALLPASSSLPPALPPNPAAAAPAAGRTAHKVSSPRGWGKAFLEGHFFCFGAALLACSRTWRVLSEVLLPRLTGSQLRAGGKHALPPSPKQNRDKGSGLGEKPNPPLILLMQEGKETRRSSTCWAPAASSPCPAGRPSW